MKLAPNFLSAWVIAQLIFSVGFVSEAKSAPEKIVRVLEVSGTLRTAKTLIGGDSVPEVFVTLYRIDGLARIAANSMKNLLKRADGTFYQDDPLPTTPDARLIAKIEDGSGIMFAINRNGEIKYRRVREFANGLFEYENRKGTSGSFMDKELAAKIFEELSKTPERPEVSD